MSLKSPEPLTPRETAVLGLLREGLSNKAIARSICVSEQTVKYHLKNLFLKLGAQGRTHAVAIASRTFEDPVEAPPPDPGEARRHMELAQSPLAFARRTRRLHAQREAVVDGELRLSYEQFFSRCDRAAAALAALGVKPGDRVAVIAPNTHTHLEQCYAVPQIGAVLVPINPRLAEEDFAYVIGHCAAAVVCASSDNLERIDAVRAQLPEVRQFIALEGRRDHWLAYEDLLARSDGKPPRVEIAEDDLLTINYTSGTSGRPRGVMLSHRNLWHSVLGLMLHWPLRCTDRYLWVLPMTHVNGWTFVWTVTAAGATHVCTRELNPEHSVALLVRERVTALCAGRASLKAVVRGAEEWSQRAQRGVRMLIAGSSPSASNIERIERCLGWEISHAYGLTETSCFIAFRDPQNLLPDASAMERARFKSIQGVELLVSGELRVVDEEGQDVPRDGQTLGEIVARGGTVMRGYYRDPEATAQAFAGGWFHTGDAAVMHADGSLEIRDRFKDIIISGDEVVSSIEVENLLQRHPGVQDAAVVGVPHESLGEVPQAFVTLCANASIDAEALQSYASLHLAPFKVPARIVIVNALPRTPTGKLVKHRLRSWAQNADTAEGNYPPE